MATVTPNLNLELPLGTENVSRQLINSNNTKIDTFAGNVQEELDNTAKEVTDLKDAIKYTTEFENLTWTEGYYYELIPGTTTTIGLNDKTASSQLKCAYLAVAPGEAFRYMGTSRGTARNLIFTTANGTVLDAVYEKNVYVDKIIYAPETATYMLVNSDKSLNTNVIRLNKYTMIPSGSDLDSFTEDGDYACSNNTICATLTNKPDKVVTAFLMHVYAHRVDSANNFIQMIMTIGSDLSYAGIFMRWHTTNGYSDWVTVYKANDIKLEVRNLQLIPNGTDMDDLIEYGSYYCPNATTSATLENLPFLIESGFSLYVYNSGSPGSTDRYIRQVIFANKKEYSSIYTRTKNVEWGAWQLMTTAEMIHSPHILELSTYVPVPRMQGTPKKTIRVASHNVAHYWMQGQATDQYLADYPIKIARWRKCLMNFNADVMFLQECEDYLDANHTISAFNTLYAPFFDSDHNIDQHWADRTDKVGRADPSRRKILNRLGLNTETKLVTVPTTQGLSYDAYFNWVIVPISGVGNVLLINAHNWSGTGVARIAERLNYLNTLASFIQSKTYDYFIIAGDFNTKETASDHPNLLSFCESVNAIPANGGLLGWLATCNQEELPRTYDNIIVSNNIRIETVDCDSMLTPSGQIHSDHTPIIATISFM